MTPAGQILFSSVPSRVLAVPSPTAPFPLSLFALSLFAPFPSAPSPVVLVRRRLGFQQ